MPAPRKAATAATPSPAPSASPQAPFRPSAAPSGLMESAAVPEHWNADGSPRPGNPLLDPGPPPRMAAPPADPHPHILVLRDVVLGVEDGGDTGTAREHALSVSIFRAPPTVGRYKAEVLAWLDAVDQYRGRA